MLNTNEVRTVCKGDFMWIKGLDGIDNQIINLLLDDARMSYSEIAQIVGLTRTSVKNRIIHPPGIATNKTQPNPFRISLLSVLLIFSLLKFFSCIITHKFNCKKYATFFKRRKLTGRF